MHIMHNLIFLKVVKKIHASKNPPIRSKARAGIKSTLTALASREGGFCVTVLHAGTYDTTERNSLFT